MSTAWVSSWPTASLALANSDLSETVANYLGLASPACAPFVGKGILGSCHKVLDPWGHILLTDNRLVNKRNARTNMHDTLVYSLSSFLHEAGIQHATDVVGLFHSCVAPTCRPGLLSTSNLVPDFAIQEGAPTPGGERLADVKTIVQCPTRYKRAAVERRRDGSRSPVDERQHSVHHEYVRHAKYADEKFCGVPSDAPTGPFRQRLAEYGTVLGLVFGHYAEASSNVHSLIHRAAERIAVATGLQEGCSSLEVATAAQTRRLYRTFSIVCHRERARLVLQGLQYVGDGRAAAAAQREQYFRRAHYQERQQAYQTAGGPFVFRTSSRRGAWRPD